jgi:hypothetical protein
MAGVATPATAIILDANPQTRFHGGVMNISRPRFRLILAGIILLISGIIFAEKHHAATLNAHHIISPELTYTVPPDSAELSATNKSFSDSVNLWFNPAQEIHYDCMTYARVLFQSELVDTAAAYDRVETRNADRKINLPSMNIADKSVNYSLFTIGNFTANLNLTPVLPTPQAIIPTEIKPGLGGSFSF